MLLIFHRFIKNMRIVGYQSLWYDDLIFIFFGDFWNWGLGLMNMFESDDEIKTQTIRMLIRINNLLIKHGNSDRLAGSFGLSQQQWSLLSVLHRSGQGMTMTELGKNLLVTKANMTGMIDRLERDGFVQRHADQFDRRVTKVVLTEKGHEFIRAIEGPNNQFQDEMFADFTRQDLEEFYKYLERFYKRLDT
jgi:DNA-binding MarR family transcriptional regulator